MDDDKKPVKKGIKISDSGQITAKEQVDKVNKVMDESAEATKILDSINGGIPNKFTELVDKISGGLHHTKLAGIMKDLSKTQLGSVTHPFEPIKTRIPDLRSSEQRRADKEQELAKIDKQSISSALNVINDFIKQDRATSTLSLTAEANNIKNCLLKFEKYIDDLEEANSDKARKIALKKEEQKLDAKYDFWEKVRLFGFRVLGSILLIVTVFAIGTIDAKVEWLHLPLSSYINKSTVIKSVMPTNYTQSMPSDRWVKVED